MNCSGLLRLFLIPLLLANSLVLAAKPRQRDWEKVDAALGDDQPQTAIGLLKPLESAAFADHAWGEGTKALAMRIALEARPAGRPSAAIKQLAAETTTAPPEARPLLRLLEARWLLSYYRAERGHLASRSTGGVSAGDDIDTWDEARMLTEIDKLFQDSLADPATLQKTPVAQWNGLLERGDLDDDLRPTLYDFIAHVALDF